jgi:hypothetical protein
MALDGLAGISDESSKAVSHSYMFPVEGAFFLGYIVPLESRKSDFRKKRKFRIRICRNPKP